MSATDLHPGRLGLPFNAGRKHLQTHQQNVLDGVPRGPPEEVRRSHLHGDGAWDRAKCPGKWQ